MTFFFPLVSTRTTCSDTINVKTLDTTAPGLRSQRARLGTEACGRGVHVRRRQPEAFGVAARQRRLRARTDFRSNIRYDRVTARSPAAALRTANPAAALRTADAGCGPAPCTLLRGAARGAQARSRGGWAPWLRRRSARTGLCRPAWRRAPAAGGAGAWGAQRKGPLPWIVRPRTGPPQVQGPRACTDPPQERGGGARGP